MAPRRSSADSVWNTSDATVGAVDADGTVDGVKQGQIQVNATFRGQTVSSNLTVSNAVLNTVSMTPFNSKLPLGINRQFHLIGNFSDGTTQDLSPWSQWFASEPLTVTEIFQGEVIGLSAGVGQIGAQFGNFSASTPVTVTDATLSSMSVTPASITLRQGQSQPLTATGTFSDGYSQNLLLNAVFTPGNRQIIEIGEDGIAFADGVGSTQIITTFQNQTITTPVLVLSNTLSALTVTPSAPALDSGAQQQLSATGTYTDGTASDVSSWTTWTSSNPAVLNVDENGLLTAYPTSSPVTVTVTALSGGTTQSVTVTVYPAGTSLPAPTLGTLIVIPTSSWLEVGNAEQLLALGTYSDGSAQNLTSSVTWASANPGTVTISSSGVATGVAPGLTTITAQSGPIQSHTTVVVGTGSVTSVAISPSGNNIAPGASQQLTLTGSFSDLAEQSLNLVTTWTSSTPSVATVSAAGVVTGVAPGTTQITGSALGQTATTTVIITSATLRSITITPSNASIAVSTLQPFAVFGTYSDGSTHDVTAGTTFTSSNPAVMAISSPGLPPAQGLGVIPGLAQITASFGGQTATTQSVTVTAGTLVSLAVTPNIASFANGTTQRFIATATFSDGSTQDLSGQVTWTSSNPQVLTIDEFGIATGGSAGSVQITASRNGISATTGTVNVTLVTLTNLALSPTTASIAKGASQQFIATGTYSNGTSQNLSSLVNWASSNGTVAFINASGLATGTGVGSAQITASYQGQSVSTSSFQVTTANLVSISFSPVNPSLAPGSNVQVTVTGTYSDGTTQNLSSSATYSSSNPAAVTVSSTGLVTAVAPGTSTITVTVNGQTTTFTVTVTTGTLTSLAITPANPPALAKGGTQQFTATGTYSDGSTQNLSTAVTWISTNSSVLTINSSGLATATGVGSATITAVFQGQTASTPPVQVTSPAVTSISVSPANASITTGSTQQYTATATYSDGTAQNVTSSVTWSSSSQAVATISATGLATGVATGATTIAAQLNSVSGSVALTVTTQSTPNPVVTSIVVVPTSSRAAAGTAVQFTAIGYLSNGLTENLSSVVTWSSSNNGLATVNSSGLATAVTPGTVTIQATSGSLQSQATFIVSPATLVSIAISPSGASFAIGAAQQLTLTGTFSDGSTQNLNASTTWTSAATAVAIVSSSGVVTGLTPGTAQITASYQGNTATATVTINAALLLSIAIYPANLNFANGTTQQFTVIGTYSDGSTHDITSTATFISSNPTVVSVSSTGLATAAGPGSAQITVTLDGQTTTTQSVTVTSATLISIAINPSSVNFANGTTQQFTAIGTFSDNTTQNLTNQVIWSSSNPQVLTINQYGLAASGGTGSAQITAALNGISSTTGTVQITQSVLSSLTIAPTSATIAKNTSVQFTATATYSDGSTRNVTNSVIWSSSNGAVASVNAAGLATGNSAGSAQITASYQGLSTSTTSFQVTSATLLAITFSPNSPSVPVGGSIQVTVTGTFSDGSTQNLNSSSTFSSSNTAVVTVNNVGVVTGVASGVSIITVQVDGVTSVFTTTVTSATLTSITITPSSPQSFAKGATDQFTATGNYSDGSTQNLTSTVTWSSSNTAVLTLSTSGLATGTGVGSATISAAYQGQTATTPAASVTAATVASIAVTPANVSITTTATQQFAATATYTDATTQNVTSSVTWSSSNQAAATINSAGFASGVAAGSTTIAAQLNSISGSTSLTVTNPGSGSPTLTSITITPSATTVPRGTTQQFAATGNYSDGSTLNLTTLATWQSSVTSVATINSTGLASAVAGGNTQISASYQGQSATVVMTVTTATLSSLAVTPATASIADGTNQQFTATGTLSDGSTLNLSNSVAWSSSSQATATINASGLASSVAAGTTTITAQAGSSTATASLTVTAATVLVLQLSPSTVSLPASGTQQLTATATFSNATSQNVTTSVAYTTSNAAVATVNTSGILQGLGAGSATITATLGGSTASTTVTVTSATLNSLAITPANPRLAASMSQQLTATGTYSDGTTQNLTNSVAWSSSATSAASISTTGNVVAAHSGTATITAVTGSVSASSTVTVTNATITAISVSPASTTLAVGQTQQFAATATLSDSTQQTNTTTAHWSVSDPTKATVSNSSGSNGLLTSIAAGTVSVTATQNSASGSAQTTITTATLSSVTISPNPVTLPAGATSALTVTGNYSDGSSANLNGSTTWTTGSSAIATVDTTACSMAIAPARRLSPPRSGRPRVQPWSS